MPVLKDRLLALAKHPQFFWWLGHITTFTSSIFYLIGVITFNSNPGHYSRAYMGALVSYGVVVYKSFGTPEFSIDFVQRLFMDENVQYFLIAFYWWTSPPIALTLLPFATFSAFHTLGYLRTNIIPTFFPNPTPNATGPAPGFPTTLSAMIKSWTDANYGPAMQFVSYVEVVGIMSWLILGALTFQTSPFAFLVFGHFLRFRFFMSSYTRAAFHSVAERLDYLLLPPTADPRVPYAVGKAYEILRSLAVRYGHNAAQVQTH
jgi:hypothetical protein